MCDEEEYFLEILERLRCQQEFEDYYADVMHDEMMIERVEKEMERKVIDLSTIIMEMKQIFQLENYIWKDKYLIPEEMYDDFIKSKKEGE